MKFSIKGLIKFGRKEYLEALLNEGVVYMNNIDYFRKYEEKQPEHLRGDQYECFEKISQGHKILIFSNPMMELNNVTQFENRNTYSGYIYCLYAIRSDEIHKFSIDGRMLAFGKYAVIIHNPLAFIHRIEGACDKKHLYPNCYPVCYYNDETEERVLTPFNKRNKYAYQKEARIYIHSAKPQDNLILKLGSIQDIACLVQFKDN